ncbi:MAG: hypothetical protein ACYDH3_09370 [Candidatus Aminicenantales bacterium]
MQVHSDSPRFARIVLIAVLIFAAAVLIVFRAREQTGDSLEYAQSARSGSLLFHPHHLLFNAVIRCFWNGIKVVFPSADPIAAGQSHNILWALITLAAVFVIVRRMTGSTGATVVFTLGLFVTAGIWQYATFIEVYVPSIGCLAVVLALLYLRRPGPPSFGLQAAIVALCVLGILYNQMVIFFVAALAVLWTPRFGFRAIRRTAGLIAAIGFLVLGAYIAAFLTTVFPKTPAGFVHWCLSYAFSPDPAWGSFQNISVIGLSREFLSFIRDVLFIPYAVLRPAAVLSGLICAGLTFFIVRSIIRRKPESNLRIALFLWILATTIFMWWFSPGGEELSIPLLLPVLLLVVRLLADAWESAADVWAVRRRIVCGAAAIAALIFIINLIGAVLPAHASRGFFYERAVLLQKSAPAEAAIFADFESTENLRFYFKRSGAVNENPVQFSFYRRLKLEPEMIPDPEKPVLVAAEYLSPQHKPAGIFGGDVQPREWREFIEWICGCEIRDGRVVAARKPSVIAGLPGYLLLSGERSPVDGLEGLFRSLDETTAAVAPDFAGSFSAWLRRHPEEAR